MNTPATATRLSAASVLGGAPVLHCLPHSALEWVALVRQGISVYAVDAVVSVMGIGQSELAKALNIPGRRLVRRKQQGLLSSDDSAKLVRLAHVIERAAEVFEDHQKAMKWLTSPNAALIATDPLSLVDTEFGAAAILSALGRIESGVFA